MIIGCNDAAYLSFSAHGINVPCYEYGPDSQFSEDVYLKGLHQPDGADDRTDGILRVLQ